MSAPLSPIGSKRNKGASRLQSGGTRGSSSRRRKHQQQLLNETQQSASSAQQTQQLPMISSSAKKPSVQNTGFRDSLDITTEEHVFAGVTSIKGLKPGEIQLLHFIFHY